MVLAAENDPLPQAFQLDEVAGIMCSDIGDLCRRFEKDTELELTANLFVCRDCGKTHIRFEVDYKEDEEEIKDKTYLQ